MRRSSFESVLVLVSWLAVSIAAPAATAQDAVLSTVDELIAGGHCDAALALIDHAQGSAPSLAGRRGLCEARLGRTADASGHIAQALRVPTDPWVQAHRSELLAALSAAPVAPPATPATLPPVVPNVVPSVVPNVVPSSSPPAATPTNPAHPPVTMSAEFVDHFARNPPADVPLPRITPRFERGRFVLRAIANVGVQLAIEGGHLEGPPWPAPAVVSGESGTSIMAPRFDLGVEADFAASRRASLITQLDFGVLSSNGQGSFGQVGYYYYGGGGPVAWSPGISLRWLAGFRFAVGREGRGIVGTSARLGLVRFHGSFSTNYTNGSGGTVMANFTHWDGGMTAEFVFDAGVALGPSRDVVLLFRNSTGFPLWSGQVMVGIPLVRSHR